MSISLLPIRLSHLLPDWHARQPRHSAPAEAERLRNKLTWADLLIKTQQVQLDDAALRETKLEQLVVKQQADIDDLTAERDELRDQLAALHFRFGPELAAEANANRITVPPMIRDTSDPADQATAPIDVSPLWDALGIRPVTDPGRIH